MITILVSSQNIYLISRLLWLYAYFKEFLQLQKAKKKSNPMHLMHTISIGAPIYIFCCKKKMIFIAYVILLNLYTLIFVVNRNPQIL